MPEVYCIVNKTVKLSEPSGKITIQQPLAYDNSLAHMIRVTVLKDDGTPEYLENVGVVGSFMRADNNTVTPIDGEAVANVADIILPPSCYVVPGRFKFTMNLTNLTDASGVDDFDATESYSIGDTVVYHNVVYRFVSAHAAGAWTGSDVVIDSSVRTILWVEGTVERNISGTIIDPGTPVGNIPQAIANANAAATSAASAAAEAFEAADEAEAYSESVAPDYSDVVFPIAAYHQLCWHEGGFYVNNTNISTTEAWTAAHWTETDISTELNRLVHINEDIASVAEAKTYLGIT